MALGRSPNYPRTSLEEALEKTREVYTQQHIYAADKEVLSKNLGYGGINGGSQAMIASLSAYGLLTKEGEGLRVSDDAVSILELPVDSSQRVGLIKTLANKPDVFAELDTEYGEKLPQNELIRHFLIKKKFLPKAADEVIRIFRANLEFVNELDNKYNKDMKSSATQTAEIVGRTVTPAKMYGGGYGVPIQEKLFGEVFEPSEPTNSNQELKFRLSADSDVRLVFRGDVTQEAVTKLIKLLELSMDTFPSQASLPTKVVKELKTKDNVSVNEVQEIESDFRNA